MNLILEGSLKKIMLLIGVQYFTQFGHMAELSESDLVLQKLTNYQAK
jgi:hypothetical protein